MRNPIHTAHHRYYFFSVDLTWPPQCVRPHRTGSTFNSDCIAIVLERYFPNLSPLFFFDPASPSSLHKRVVGQAPAVSTPGAQTLHTHTTCTWILGISLHFKGTQRTEHILIKFLQRYPAFDHHHLQLTLMLIHTAGLMLGLFAEICKVKETSYSSHFQDVIKLFFRALTGSRSLSSSISHGRWVGSVPQKRRLGHFPLLQG